MKRLLLLAIAVPLASVPLSAGTIVFDGITLSYNSALGSVVNNPNGSITVTQSSAAELDLIVASGFPNASYSYIDNTSTNIDLFEQSFGSLNARVQIGSAFTCCGQIDYERYNNPAIENIDYFVSTRTNGAAHTISDMVNPDGSIIFTNDGVVTRGTFLQAHVPGFSGFDQTLLRVRSNGSTSKNSVIFTALSLSNTTSTVSSVTNVPEPGSVFLALSGLLGVLSLRRAANGLPSAGASLRLHRSKT